MWYTRARRRRNQVLLLNGFMIPFEQAFIILRREYKNCFLNIRLQIKFTRIIYADVWIRHLYYKLVWLSFIFSEFCAIRCQKPNRQIKRVSTAMIDWLMNHCHRFDVRPDWYQMCHPDRMKARKSSSRDGAFPSLHPVRIGCLGLTEYWQPLGLEPTREGWRSDAINDIIYWILEPSSKMLGREGPMR